MKIEGIGAVYTRYNGPLPFRPGSGIRFGELLSRAEVESEGITETCPGFLFAYPVKPRVAPVVWIAPTDDGCVYTNITCFDWSNVNTPGGLEETIEKIAFGNFKNPPRHFVAMLKLAEKYFNPFTRLAAASKLAEAVAGLNESELTQFLEALGQKRNAQTLRVLKEDLFIARRWGEWESISKHLKGRFDLKRPHGVTYAERVEDMREHGFQITEETFKKRVQKWGLKPL